MMLALVVSVAASDVELASDILWSLGVVAIEERAEADRVELWTSVGDDVEAAAQLLSERLAQWRWRFVEVMAFPSVQLLAYAALPVFAPLFIAFAPAPTAFTMLW